MKSRVPVLAVGIGLALALAVQTLHAAFQEDDLIDEINSTVAVLRYLHGQVKDVREKLAMVNETRLLTEKQYASQEQLVKDEEKNEKPNPIKLEVYKIDLAALRRQSEKLAATNLEKTFAERTDQLNKVIERYRMQLDAKILEFRVHFGKSPNVNLDFEARISRFRHKELGVTYLRVR